MIAVGGALSEATKDILTFFQSFAKLTGAVKAIGTRSLDAAGAASLLNRLGGLNKALGDVEKSLQGLAEATGNDASQIQHSEPQAEE